MHLPSVASLLLSALPLTSATPINGHGNDKSNKGLDYYAKKAGLKYFGAATDSPGFRERAPYASQYPKYDQIMWKSGEFGQTTPTNGMKVSTTTTNTMLFSYSLQSANNTPQVALHRTHPERLQLHRRRGRSPQG